jgi:hypothetical protein
MATTTNFGWTTPNDTDLVKDGAAAIRTLGSAIDTSMAELKGGTTGQILSKTSNTDMDFTWIANDQGDITGITASSPLTGGGTSGAITVGIQDGTTAQKGAVQLENSTSSTSTTTAAVPASVKSAYDLADGAIAKSTLTTTGDILYRNSTVPTRLGIGTAGQVLTVNSGATAPEWKTASSGSLTKISTTALSGSSGSISNCFSSTYDNYVVVFSDIVNATGTGDFAFYMRTGSTNTTSGYDSQGFYINNTSVVGYGWTGDLVQAYCTTTRSTAGIIHIFSPYLAKDTVAIMHQSGPDFSRTNFGTLPNTTSYESLGWALGTGTITGNLTIYGLEK